MDDYRHFSVQINNLPTILRLYMRRFLFKTYDLSYLRVFHGTRLGRKSSLKTSNARLKGSGPRKKKLNDALFSPLFQNGRIFLFTLVAYR